MLGAEKYTRAQAFLASQLATFPRDLKLIQLAILTRYSILLKFLAMQQCCGFMACWHGSGSAGSVPLINGSGSYNFRH
jgi:hypothetical protein